MATEQKRMRQLYATELEWQNNNPVLLDGEIALSSDVRRYKVGPGAWSTLPYWDAQSAFPEAPQDGFTYGRENALWTRVPRFKINENGNLNNLPDEPLTIYEIGASGGQNGWVGIRNGDLVLQQYDPGSGLKFQIGFSGYPTSNQEGAQIYTRAFIGSWTSWEGVSTFNTAPYSANLDALANSHNKWQKSVHVGSGVGGGWPNISPDSLVTSYNIGENRAIQVGFDPQSGNSHGIWMRQKSGGTWSAWERTSVSEEDIFDLDRVRWRDPYVFGTEYKKNDMVRDGSWTMIANTDTTERAAPQEDGNPIWTAPDLPAWQTLSHSGVVESGMRYENAVPITLIGYEIWVPTVTPDYNYVIRTFLYYEDDQSDIRYEAISEPLLVENNWTTIAVTQSLITAGAKFGILVNALNSGSDTVVGPYDWGRGANDNNAAPASGDWNRNNNSTTLRIHKVDDNGVNRGADGDGSLEGIIPGSTIQIVNQTDATQSSTYTVSGAPTYDGTVYSFPVTDDGDGVGGEPPVGAITVITITVPLPSPTEYVQVAPNTTGYGTGILRFDGVDQPGADANLFGVRILYDTWTASADWDIVSTAGGGGGGGSGGGGGPTTFESLTDTPDSYAGQAGKGVKVTQAEDGLEYADFAPINHTHTTFVMEFPDRANLVSYWSGNSGLHSDGDLFQHGDKLYVASAGSTQISDMNGLAVAMVYPDTAQWPLDIEAEAVSAGAGVMFKVADGSPHRFRLGDPQRHDGYIPEVSDATVQYEARITDSVQKVGNATGPQRASGLGMHMVLDDPDARDDHHAIVGVATQVNDLPDSDILVNSISGVFIPGNSVTGGTSGAVATVASWTDNGDGTGYVGVNNVVGSFLAGEIVTDAGGGSATVSAIESGLRQRIGGAYFAAQAAGTNPNVRGLRTIATFDDQNTTVDGKMVGMEVGAHNFGGSEVERVEGNAQTAKVAIWATSGSDQGASNHRRSTAILFNGNAGNPDSGTSGGYFQGVMLRNVARNFFLGYQPGLSGAKLVNGENHNNWSEHTITLPYQTGISTWTSDGTGEVKLIGHTGGVAETEFPFRITSNSSVTNMYMRNIGPVEQNTFAGLTFQAYNDNASEIVNYAAIDITARDTTPAAETGRYRIYTRVAGVDTEELDVSDGVTVGPTVARQGVGTLNADRLYEGDTPAFDSGNDGTQNNSYTKFPDGTLILYGSVIVQYTSASQMLEFWTFPVPFASGTTYGVTPTINASSWNSTVANVGLGEVAAVSAGTLTNTSCNIQVRRVPGGTNFIESDTCQIRVMAIGRWK